MSIQLTGNRVVGSEDRPYVIAELGSNHNGNMDLARKLIQSAKDAGADCVKFQSWSKESIFSKQKYEENHFLGDDYRDREDYSLEKIVEEYSISESELIAMKKFSDEVGIDFTSTPFSWREADFLIDQLYTPFIKVASMDLNNYPFLEYLAKKGKPMVVSTGMGTLSEIDQAVRTIESTGNDQIVILHCVSIYPPKDRELNLKIIDTLSTMYPYPIGFSDHTLGTCVPLAAVAKGACLIEKHFTLDKGMEGWDHRVSADYEDMLELTRNSKRIFNALGSNRVEHCESEERIKEFRRSIVAARDISVGEVIKADMLDYKRPGGGFTPDFSTFIIGRKAQKDIPFDSMILPDNI
jgi:sialic acid synthase SpsE